MSDSLASTTCRKCGYVNGEHSPTCGLTRRDLAEAFLGLEWELKGLQGRHARALEALRRIADHESRSDRRHRGMVDRSGLEDLQRIARAVLRREQE